MHKKIFNHDSCKKNKIIVSKKIFTKKETSVILFYEITKKNQRNVKRYISFFYVIFFYIKLMSLYFVGSIVI